MNLYESKTYLADLDNTIYHSVEIDRFRHSKVLVTGATGTIGSYIVDTLLRYNQVSHAEITVYAAGRNPLKLNSRFLAFGDGKIKSLPYDLNDSISFDIPIDFIIHAAGNAHPVAFNSDPVGTVTGNIIGTYNLLEYGRKHGAKRFLYISSGEIYGYGNQNIDELEESYTGPLDILSPRSCYPSSKRAAENLCVSYSKQYGLETVIVRPCHTYGPGITPSDSRASAQFIRNVLNGEDIVMKSAGTQMRSYNYVADCVSAILTVLAKGASGEAYNVVNPKVKTTIAGLADVIAQVAGRQVIFAEPDAMDLANRTPIEKQVLSGEKIVSLGWTGAYSLETGIIHTLDILQGK